MRTFSFTILSFLLFSFALTGCERLVISEMKTNPEHLVIDDHSLVLETYLWRDFMPVLVPPEDPESPENGITAAIRLVDQNENNISDRFKLSTLYLMHADDIWDTGFSNEDFISEAHYIKKIAHDGPTWDTGTHVDVALVFSDRKTGESYTILAKDQIVNRAD